jgi:hypothetical protein
MEESEEAKDSLDAEESPILFHEDVLDVVDSTRTSQSSSSMVRGLFGNGNISHSVLYMVEFGLHSKVSI